MILETLADRRRVSEAGRHQLERVSMPARLQIEDRGEERIWRTDLCQDFRHPFTTQNCHVEHALELSLQIIARKRPCCGHVAFGTVQRDAGVVRAGKRGAAHLRNARAYPHLCRILRHFEMAIVQ